MGRPEDLLDGVDVYSCSLLHAAQVTRPNLTVYGKPFLFKASVSSLDGHKSSVQLHPPGSTV